MFVSPNIRSATEHHHKEGVAVLAKLVKQNEIFSIFVEVWNQLAEVNHSIVLIWEQIHKLIS